MKILKNMMIFRTSPIQVPEYLLTRLEIVAHPFSSFECRNDDWSQLEMCNLLSMGYDDVCEGCNLVEKCIVFISKSIFLSNLHLEERL